MRRIEEMQHILGVITSTNGPTENNERLKDFVYMVSDQERRENNMPAMSWRATDHGGGCASLDPDYQYWQEPETSDSPSENETAGADQVAQAILDRSIFR